MTGEAPDLILRLPRRHFFYASLYSPPRPGILSLTVPRVSTLIRSPCRFVHVVLRSFAPPLSCTVSKVSAIICSPCRVV
jgi:hypothetical protein